MNRKIVNKFLSLHSEFVGLSIAEIAEIEGLPQNIFHACQKLIDRGMGDYIPFNNN